MFYWFVKDYETNVFKADDRKLSALYFWEKALFFILITLSIACFFTNLYSPISLVNLILLCCLVGLLFVIYFLEEHRRKKEFNSIVERFKKDKLELLIKMLQDKKYSISEKSLDSKEGIEWLLKACSTEIEKQKNKPSIIVPAKNYFFTLVLPLATYIGGTYASTLSNSEKKYFSIMLLIILLLICGMFCAVVPSVNDLLTKRIRVVEDLKDNLEYYKMIKDN